MGQWDERNEKVGGGFATPFIKILLRIHLYNKKVHTYILSPTAALSVWVGCGERGGGLWFVVRGLCLG